MSVRQSLLAILDQGACYGYQLRAEFERRTGSTSPLNVGQIYNTLERLERDGLVARGEADEHGHVYWRITDTGRIEARDWLDSPVLRAPGARDELAIKLALAATLPGVDVGVLIRRQRQATLAHLRRLREPRPAPRSGPEELAGSLVVDHLAFQAEAELRWLDHVEERLAAHPDHAIGLELATERPKRGRPAKAPLAVA
ncbi:transcriptional regulator [Microbacterium sp. Root53]|uniref:PadR family transcriptional regulator n=1 Tax=Microbacterium sp. Root53 TaxID=1736553 RepID=UPI0006F51720|nr:PadR family transcriptional regulator [Microbacterium sp. Root53]KQZ05124.1 transcriptional regulator [Microbacterium sp. Root53]